MIVVRVLKMAAEAAENLTLFIAEVSFLIL
jgi:hypothetical protein